MNKINDRIYWATKKAIGEMPPPAVIVKHDTTYKPRPALTQPQIITSVKPYYDALNKAYIQPVLEKIATSQEKQTNNISKLAETVQNQGVTIKNQSDFSYKQGKDIHNLVGEVSRLVGLTNLLKTQKDSSDRDSRTKNDRIIKLQNLIISKQEVSDAASNKNIAYIQAALTVLFVLSAIHAYRIRNEFNALKYSVNELKQKTA